MVASFNNGYFKPKEDGPIKLYFTTVSEEVGIVEKPSPAEFCKQALIGRPILYKKVK
jgi:hypothetical protein